MSESFNNELVTQYYKSHYKMLYTFALVQVKDEETARDLVHDTFFLAVKCYDKFSSSPNKVGWLVNTLKMVLKQHYKDWIKTNTLLNSLVDLHPYKNGGMCDDYNIRTELQGIIDKDSLELLIRIYCEKCSYAEAAKDLGISLSACKSRVKAAKEKLRKYYEK